MKINFSSESEKEQTISSLTRVRRLYLVVPFSVLLTLVLVVLITSAQAPDSNLANPNLMIAGSLSPSAAPASTMHSLSEVASKNTSDTFDRSTDSLEAIRDRMDTVWTDSRAGYLDYLNTDLKYLISTAVGTPTTGSVAYKVNEVLTDTADLQPKFGSISDYSGTYANGTSLFKALKDIRDTLSGTLTLSGGLTAAGNISTSGNLTVSGTDLVMDNNASNIYLKTKDDATSRILYLQNPNSTGTLGLNIEDGLTVGGAITGNGSGLTNLNADNLASGTIPDARLSSNAALLNTAQTFTANKTFDASSSLYFANGTTYYINNSGTAKFNGLETVGDATVGGALNVNGTGASSVAGDLNIGGGYGFSGVTITSTGDLKLDGNIYQTSGTVYYSDALHYTGDYSVSGTLRIGYDPQVTDSTNYLAITAGGQIKHDQDLIMQIDFDDSPANQYLKVRNGSGNDLLTLDELGNFILKNNSGTSLLALDSSGNLAITGNLTGSGTLGASSSRWSTIYGAAEDLSGNLTVAGTASLANANFTVDSSGNISKLGGGAITSGVIDGASAVGFTLATPAYATAGAKLLSIKNNTDEKMTIDKDGNVGLGITTPDDKLDISGGNLDLNNNDIENVNKLTVTTIDPVYEINGKKYATYVPDMVGGVKTETMGKIEVKIPSEDGNYQAKLDLTKQPEGSDLWLFEKTADFGEKMENIVVILTPENKEKVNVWCELKPKNNQLIIYAEKPTFVFYRLSAPRIDHEKWGNVAESQAVEGIDVSAYGK